MSTSGSWLPAFLRVRFDILAGLLDRGGCVIHGWRLLALRANM